MSVASDTAEQIGWHRHGKAWVWGIRPYDDCGLCDLAEHWLSKQVDIEDVIKREIRLRRIVNAEPLVKQYVDPHAPQEIPPEAEPALDKIVRGKKAKTSKVPVPASVSSQIDLLSVSTTAASNEAEEEPTPPAPPPKPTFKLTNPDEHTLKKARRRR